MRIPEKSRTRSPASSSLNLKVSILAIMQTRNFFLSPSLPLVRLRSCIVSPRFPLVCKITGFCLSKPLCYSQYLMSLTVLLIGFLNVGAHRYLYHIKVHGVTVIEEEKRVVWCSHVDVKSVQFDCSSFAFT